jgi:hypothetical protein
MAESYGWIFVDFIPLIYDKKRLAKQVQIETWLNLAETVRELGLEKPMPNRPRIPTSPAGYIV